MDGELLVQQRELVVAADELCAEDVALGNDLIVCALLRQGLGVEAQDRRVELRDFIVLRGKSPGVGQVRPVLPRIRAQ